MTKPFATIKRLDRKKTGSTAVLIQPLKSPRNPCREPIIVYIAQGLPDGGKAEAQELADRLNREWEEFHEEPLTTFQEPKDEYPVVDEVKEESPTTKAPSSIYEDDFLDDPEQDDLSIPGGSA